jgi:hypothetical protein
MRFNVQDGAALAGQAHRIGFMLEVASVWCKGAFSFRIKGQIKTTKACDARHSGEKPERLSFTPG